MARQGLDHVGSSLDARPHVSRGRARCCLAANLAAPWNPDPWNSARNPDPWNPDRPHGVPGVPDGGRITVSRLEAIVFDDARTPQPKEDGDVRLGSPLMSIDVPTREVQQALQAVLPHVSPDRDAPEPMLRVHWKYDPITGHLYVGATCGVTVGLSAVSVMDDRIAVDHGFRWATTAITGKQIRAAFPTKDSGNGDGGYEDFLRFELHPEWVVVTDVSGMFVGEQGRWRQFSDPVETVNLLGVVQSVLGSVSAGQAELFTAPAVSVLSGRHLASFKAASAAYESPLLVESGSHADRHVVLVSCSDSFLGLIREQPVSEEDTAAHRAWRRGWCARLGVDLTVPVEDRSQRLVSCPK